ncbi:MAG: dephospho-CoA kinase, partial [Oscillospiraceae bacterium]|nr:dephospho-CoA kinase [Oscillospiraceae bacterium]
MISVAVIGLTGQTGAGKSTVSKIFSQNGFALIDADKISRDVVEIGKPCLAELVDYFGSQILNPDNSLNRKALAKIVFTDKRKLESLNSICHPFITEEIFRLIHQNAHAGKNLILLDAPTLFESKASDFCDMIISVIANPELRCQRIMQRDNLTRELALERMNAQLEETFFIQHSDYIIKNNADLEQLSAYAREVADKLKAYC